MHNGITRLTSYGVLPGLGLTLFARLRFSTSWQLHYQLVSVEAVKDLAGGQKLLEAYARVQQLRGMPTAAPGSISPALQQTSKVRPPLHLACM